MRAAAWRGATLIAIGLLFASLAGTAQPMQSAQITLSMLALPSQQAGLSVMVANFERVYPNISVQVTYAPSVASSLETTELAAGNAPDLLTTLPGCGSPIAVCELATAGDLAPLVKAPWTKRSIPLATSASKHGAVLYAFAPDLSPYGMFVNGPLFARLGLKIPRTFSQLLDVCQQAKAAGMTAITLDPGVLDLSFLLTELAVPTVYSPDPMWLEEVKAGKDTFDGSAGWHRALQEFLELNQAGCFQPGATGYSTQTAEALFAQGQGLMFPGISSFGGPIQADDPQFQYSFHPFPGASKAGAASTYLNLNPSISVNAHSSPQNQAAAIEFIDFMGRPKQDAVYAGTRGSLTQYQFLKDDLPSNMTTFTSVFAGHAYVINPQEKWWNADVLGALEQDDIGLITGQESIDDILNAMDAGWKQGPS